MIRTLLTSLCLLPLVAGCTLDPLIWGETTASDFALPPAAGTSTISGRSSLMGAGAAVAFTTPGGVTLDDAATTTGDGGAFSAEFAASTELINTIVTVSDATRAMWGVVPELPKKATVYDPPIAVTMGQGPADADGPATVPFMDDLGVESTTATLLVLAKSRYSDPPTTLASLSPSALTGALTEIASLIEDGDPRVAPLAAMVERILTAGATTAPALRPFADGNQSYLDATRLSAGTDYDDDGAADTDSAAFDAALRAAIGALEFNVCYAPDTIRVVLIVDFRDGGVSEGSCSAIDRFKWLEPKVMTDDKRMFVTGSLHPDTPNCDTDEPPCLTPEVYDAGSQALGNWTPNVTPMYDDGTHGDAVAGDNLWTFTVDLPWFDGGGPTDRWVRISYKYTWGTQGALWTGSEEWPGNQRILELRDVNGDHLIVRQDVWADEATNKDKQNLRPPNKGGCGSVKWQSDVTEERLAAGCVDDTLERPIDTDRDCIPDAWPSQFTASPITTPCDQ